MNRLFAITIIAVNVIRTALGQNSTNYDCCSINMMDSRGRVAIETRRQLTSGTFLALRVRACTTDPVAVQIWRLTGNRTLNFRWQTVITPVLSPVMRTFVTVNLSPALVLTSDDRLGVFSPLNLTANMSVLSIPFGFDENDYYLYYSSSVFSSFSAFDSSVQVTLDDLRWPRSFVGSIFFCQQSGCSDLIIQASTVTPPPPTGTPRSNECCPNPITCDQSGISTPLFNQTQTLQDLNREIADLSTIIRDLMSSRLVTGLCPQGFTPGTYGVGKCYLVIRDQVPMAGAALRCQTEYDSLLMQIKGYIDESFLRTLLSTSSNTGEVSFWTAGMYNADVRQWFWYDDSLRVKSPMTYSNWRNGVVPTPSSDADVCMKLIVSQGATNSSYWSKADCNENNFFVCQVYKTCF